MKKIILLMTVLIAIVVTGCSNEEQKNYEHAMQQAKEQITEENFAEAHEFLTEAISTGYEENSEAKNLLNQLEQYQSLENLVDEGKLEEVLEIIENIAQIENGSTVISNKAKEFQEIVEHKINMLNWTDEEIEQYIADYFHMEVDHVIVFVYDRTSSSYKIEARENGLAFGKYHDPALGFFEVRADGKLYKQDIFSGDYILVN